MERTFRWSTIPYYDWQQEPSVWYSIKLNDLMDSFVYSEVTALKLFWIASPIKIPNGVKTLHLKNLNGWILVRSWLFPSAVFYQFSVSPDTIIRQRWWMYFIFCFYDFFLFVHYKDLDLEELNWELYTVYSC